MRYKQIKTLTEQTLFEVNMSPGNLRKLASQINARAGMEFEMIVPNVKIDGQEDFESEPDYGDDPRTRSISDIREFFHDGDHNGRREVDELVGELEQEFFEWRQEKLDEEWASDGREFFIHWVRENVSDDEWLTGAEDEDEDTAFTDYVNNELADQGRNYSQAREEFDNDHENDWDSGDWLSAVDYDYMTDISRNFDINWPYYTEYQGDDDNMDVENVADDFGSAIGRPVNHSTDYHGARREEGTYVVEPDGSLHGDDSSDGGLEFVSPPLPIAELLSDLQKVKKWAKRRGCYTGSDYGTGLHINVSVDGWKGLENLDYVKLALLLGDDYVLQQFERQSNNYCKSALELVKTAVKKDPDKAKEMLDKMKEHMNVAASKLIHSGITNKFTSINTKDGYVEFRSPGGDWLNDKFDLIEPTLLRFVVALDAAVKPDLYKQEYLKKLYKLISPSGDKSTIEYFAKYVAGEIPKAALRSFVKQAQLQRKVERDPTGGQKYWWNVKLDGQRVEVVATSKKEAFDAALDTNPEWMRYNINQAEITPLRPYDETSGQSQVRVIPRTLDGHPSNPNGNHVIVPSAGSDEVAYRFQAANGEEALDVVRQWRREHPSDNPLRPWVTRVDPDQRLGQPAGTQQPAPQGITVAGRPNNPEGDWYLKNGDTDEIFYRFNAADYADAYNVLQQWKQENPDSTINAMYGRGRAEPAPQGGGTYRITTTGGGLIAGDEYGDDQTALQRAQYWAQRRNVDVVVRNPQGQEVGRVSASGDITPTAQQPAQQNQGNWGIWINANDRFANQPGTYARGETPPLYRFPSREAAEQWIEQQRADRPNMRTDIEVREIEPAQQSGVNNFTPRGPGPWELYNTQTGSVFRRLEHTNRNGAETEAETYYNLYSSTLGDRTNYSVRTQQGAAQQTHDAHQAANMQEWTILNGQGAVMGRVQAATQGEANQRAAGFLGMHHPNMIGQEVEVVPSATHNANQPSQAAPQQRFEIYKRSTGQSAVALSSTDQPSAWAEAREMFATRYAAYDPSEYSVRAVNT
jgi:hypothetical protein